MRNRQGNIIVTVILVLFIILVAGLGLYYYFVVGPSRAQLTKPSTATSQATETVMPTSTDPNDLDRELQQLPTDDTSITLDATTDTAGL